MLRQRDFRLLFCGQSVSLLGDGMITVALAFAVVELGGPVSAVGLVFAARMVPLILCLLVGGVVADRTSPRGVMVAADVVRAASQGATAVLLVAGTAELWSLAALAGVTGAATGFFTPASTGLLPAVVAADDLQRANGLRGSAMAAGEIGGPILAGLLVAAAGAGWALAIDAGTFLVSAVLLTRLRLAPRPTRDHRSFATDLHDGWREFRARRWVWAFVGCVALGSACWAAWNALGPVVAKQELGGAAAWGTVLSAMGIGSLIGGIVAMRVRPRRPMVVAACATMAFSLPLGFLAAGAPLPVLAVGALAGGVGLMLANTLWESTLQRLVPAAALSRVSAYDWFGSMAFYPLGLAIWGPISTAVGMSLALWIAFATQFTLAALVLAVPEIRHLRGPRRVIMVPVSDPVRIDKWLWAARLAKTRALAAEAVSAGRVAINGRRVKPSREVRPGDLLELTTGAVPRSVVVRGTALRRGPAAEAALLYEETPESVAARQRHAEERRLAQTPVAEPGGRPTKRERRRLSAIEAVRRGRA